MRVSLWAYEPIECDDEFCCGDCDYCNHIPSHETDFYEYERRGKRMILNSDDGYDCYITPEEWERFIDEYDGITPCSEYGMCEECPYAKEAKE